MMKIQVQKSLQNRFPPQSLLQGTLRIRRNLILVTAIIFCCASCDVYDKKEIVQIAEDEIDLHESSLLTLEEILLSFLSETDTGNTIVLRTLGRKHTVNVHALKKTETEIVDPYSEKLSEDVRERLFYLMEGINIQAIFINYNQYFELQTKYRNKLLNYYLFIRTSQDKLNSDIPIYTVKDSIPDSPGWFYKVKEDWYVYSPGKD